MRPAITLELLGLVSVHCNPGRLGVGALRSCAGGNCPNIHGTAPTAGNALTVTGKQDGGTYTPGEVLNLANAGGGEYALYATTGDRSDNAALTVTAPASGPLTLLSVRAAGSNTCTYQTITLAAAGGGATPPPGGGVTPPPGGGVTPPPGGGGVAGGTNNAIGQTYLDQNRLQPGVGVLPSGLQIRICQMGTGLTSPSAISQVEVHYAGRTAQNQMQTPLGPTFDSSWQRSSPQQYDMSQLIQGFALTLSIMREGDIFEVAIPADLGYGTAGNSDGTIAPGDVLVMTLQLIRVESNGRAYTPIPGASPGGCGPLPVLGAITGAGGGGGGGGGTTVIIIILLLLACGKCTHRTRTITRGPCRHSLASQPEPHAARQVAGTISTTRRWAAKALAGSPSRGAGVLRRRRRPAALPLPGWRRFHRVGRRCQTLPQANLTITTRPLKRPRGRGRSRRRARRCRRRRRLVSQRRHRRRWRYPRAGRR